MLSACGGCDVAEGARGTSDDALARDWSMRVVGPAFRCCLLSPSPQHHHQHEATTKRNVNTTPRHLESKIARAVAHPRHDPLKTLQLQNDYERTTKASGRLVADAPALIVDNRTVELYLRCKGVGRESWSLMQLSSALY